MRHSTHKGNDTGLIERNKGTEVIAENFASMRKRTQNTSNQCLQSVNYNEEKKLLMTHHI